MIIYFGGNSAEKCMNMVTTCSQPIFNFPYIFANTEYLTHVLKIMNEFSVYQRGILKTTFIASAIRHLVGGLRAQFHDDIP